jgi:hypothetical protein
MPLFPELESLAFALPPAALGCWAKGPQSTAPPTVRRGPALVDRLSAAHVVSAAARTASSPGAGAPPPLVAAGPSRTTLWTYSLMRPVKSWQRGGATWDQGVCKGLCMPEFTCGVSPVLAVEPVPPSSSWPQRQPTLLGGIDAATSVKISHARARLCGSGLPRVCLTSCMYSSSRSSGRFSPW